MRYYDRVMTIEFKAPGIKRQHAIKHRRAPKRPTHGSTSSTAEREKNRIDAASAAKRDAERRARFRLHHQDPMGARSAAAAVSAVSAVSETVSKTSSETAGAAGAAAVSIPGLGVVAPSSSLPSSLRRPKHLSVEDRKWKREISRWKANKR